MVKLVNNNIDFSTVAGIDIDNWCPIIGDLGVSRHRMVCRKPFFANRLSIKLLDFRQKR
jgi:hypothetical protein